MTKRNHSNEVFCFFISNYLCSLFLENNGTTTCKEDQQGTELSLVDLEIVVTASKSTNEEKRSKY